MKTVLEDVSSIKKRVVIEINAAEVDEKVDMAYRDINKRAKIPGFRSGKVPRKILERHYGPQVLEDVTGSLIRETLPEAMNEVNIYPLNIPSIENDIIKAGQGFKYTAAVEVTPEFELKDYLGVEVDKEICSVTDEDVKKQLEAIRESCGKLVPVEEKRGLKEGDCAVIDYEAFENGQPVDGIKAQNSLIWIGKNQFYPGVEDALIGLEKGSDTDVTMDFKEDYFNSKLAGKNIDFKVKIIDLKELELPELNDEFVKGLGADCNTLDELKDKIREEQVSREEKRIEKECSERIISKISDSVDFDLPECLVEQDINSTIDNIRQNLKQSGTDLESIGINEVKMKEDVRPGSEKRVKAMLIMGEVAKKNNLSIGDDELNEEFKKMCEGMGQDYEVMRKFNEANNVMDSIRQNLLEEKILNYLLENAKISKVEASKIPESGS
jgi:trigger factor